MELNEHQKIAIEALEDTKSDNTYRAKLAFKYCTPEQMQQNYGRSGKTRAQILAGYEARDKRIDDAIEWIKSK